MPIWILKLVFKPILLNIEHLVVYVLFLLRLTSSLSIRLGFYEDLGKLFTFSRGCSCVGSLNYSLVVVDGHVRCRFNLERGG